MKVIFAVADYDKTNREKISKIASDTEQNSIVITAANGSELNRIIGKHLPDVIITDLFMPEYSGLESVKYARSIENYFPSVIIMSGSASEKYIDICFRTGADYYAEKPVNESEFSNLLKYILKVKKHPVRA